MPDVRVRPYAQFNFLVNLADGPEDDPVAGFQEVSNIGMEVSVAEYRNGNSKENHVEKFAGLCKVSDVTMKRGVIGAKDLYNWLSDVRAGNPSARRTVTVKLQDETGTNTVLTWKLSGAFIVKHVSGPFNAKGTDVAMEELTLTYESLDVS